MSWKTRIPSIPTIPLPQDFPGGGGGGGSGSVLPVDLVMTNPGAETGNTNGWTVAAGGALWTSTNVISVGYPSNVYEGSRYFTAGGVADARQYQDIDLSTYAGLIDSGGVVAEVALRFCTTERYFDYFSMFLRALDGSGNIIASVAQEELSTSDFSISGWQREDLNFLLPVGTRKIRVECHGTRSNSGDNNVHFDAVVAKLFNNTRRITPTYGTSISRGNRSGLITVSDVGGLGNGAVASLVDGALANNYFFGGDTNDGSKWLLFDFGTPWVIDEFMWKQQNVVAHGLWCWEGSPDNINWTQIGSDFTLSLGLFQLEGANNTAYRYGRLRALSGTRSASPYLYEIQFRAKP